MESIESINHKTLDEKYNEFVEILNLIELENIELFENNEKEKVDKLSNHYKLGLWGTSKVAFGINPESSLPEPIKSRCKFEFNKLFSSNLR